jgi:hypothetical protein
LNTPRGFAFAHFFCDEGAEGDDTWICFHEDGQIWRWPNYRVRACRNITLDRAFPEKPELDMSFKSVQAKIAKKEGVSKKSAGAILAKSSRNASPAAKRKNPKLNRVKG